MTPLEIARAEAGEHLDAVLQLFRPGAKGTLLVRSPDGESQPGAHDFVITNDDLAEVAAMIDRRRAATKIGSDIPLHAAEVEPPANFSVIHAGGSADHHMGVTGNAILLLGYLAGGIYGRAPYGVVAVDAPAGTVTVEHAVSGNTYRVSVVQLEGTE